MAVADKTWNFEELQALIDSLQQSMAADAQSRNTAQTQMAAACMGRYDQAMDAAGDAAELAADTASLVATLQGQVTSMAATILLLTQTVNAQALAIAAQHDSIAALQTLTSAHSTAIANLQAALNALPASRKGVTSVTNVPLGGASVPLTFPELPNTDYAIIATVEVGGLTQILGSGIQAGTKTKTACTVLLRSLLGTALTGTFKVNWFIIATTG